MSIAAENFAELLDTFVSREDIDFVAEDIDKAGKLIFDSRIQPQDALSQSFSHERKAIVMRIAEKENVAVNDVTSIKAFLEDLRESLYSIPVIDVQIAVELPEESQIRISSQIEQSIGRKVLLNTIIKKDIIGGLVVSYNGKYGDYSVRKYLREYGKSKGVPAHADTSDVHEQAKNLSQQSPSPQQATAQVQSEVGQKPDGQSTQPTAADQVAQAQSVTTPNA